MKWLDSHVKWLINNQSLPEIMALWPQAGSKGNIGMPAYSLFLEGIVSGESRKDFREDLFRNWERLVGPIAASQCHATWGSPACRESHMFPRANLGILGHITKIEFRIATQVTTELKCFSITKTRNRSQCQIRRLCKSILAMKLNDFMKF